MSEAINGPVVHPITGEKVNIKANKLVIKDQNTGIINGSGLVFDEPTMWPANDELVGLMTCDNCGHRTIQDDQKEYCLIKGIELCQPHNAPCKKHRSQTDEETRLQLEAIEKAREQKIIDEAIELCTSDNDVILARVIDHILLEKNINILSVGMGNKKGEITLFIHDGKRYKRANSDGIENYMIDFFSKMDEKLTATIENIMEPVINLDKENPEYIKAVNQASPYVSKKKTIGRALNKNKRHSIEATLLTMKIIEKEKAKLDADFMFINEQTGVYDLLNYKEIPHDSEQRFSMLAGFEYDPYASCPMFDANLEYMLPNKETRDCFMEIIASSLFRCRREELIFFLWGQTAGNGKSELIRALLTMLGEYGIWLDPQVLTKERSRGPTQPELIKAIGKCLIAIDEPNKESIDSSTFKNMANFAEMMMRMLYEAASVERWTATVLLLCNTLPSMDMKDQGNARRPVVIPFKKKITDDMKMNDAKTRPKEYAFMKYGEYIGKTESAGIWNRIVEALKRFVERGLILPEMPEEIKTATDEYIYKNNAIARYINDKCMIEADAVIVASEFHDDFKDYCINTLGYDPKKVLLPGTIRDTMVAMGYDYKQVADKRTNRDNRKCYIGLKYNLTNSELRKSIVTYMGLLSDKKVATTEMLQKHFSKISLDLLKNTLDKMKECGEILDKGNDTWGYVPP